MRTSSLKAWAYFGRLSRRSTYPRRPAEEGTRTCHLPQPPPPPTTPTAVPVHSDQAAAATEHCPPPSLPRCPVAALRVFMHARGVCGHCVRFVRASHVSWWRMRGRYRSLSACQEGARAGCGERRGRREGVGGRAGGREGEAGATDFSFSVRFDLACTHVCTFWRRPTMLAMKRSLSSSSCFLSSTVLFECSPLGVEMEEGGWGGGQRARCTHTHCARARKREPRSA
jgi:hypothetical protein